MSENGRREAIYRSVLDRPQPEAWARVGYTLEKSTYAKTRPFPTFDSNQTSRKASLESKRVDVRVRKDAPRAFEKAPFAYQTGAQIRLLARAVAYVNANEAPFRGPRGFFRECPLRSGAKRRKTSAPGKKRF